MNGTDLAQVRRVDDLAPAMEFTRDKIDLLKRTICAGASDDELELFIHACKRTGLDPFMKQIHAVKRYDGNARREVMAIQTGIDGYRLIADRTDRYMPGREPTYVYDASGGLVSATAYVKKLAKDGTWHESSATAHYSEYVGTTRDGSPNRMWREKPHIMLAKCAESQALRRAFPAEMSGVYTSEEMDKADSPAPKSPPAPQSPEDFMELFTAAVEDRGLGTARAQTFIDSFLAHNKIPSVAALNQTSRARLLQKITDGDYDSYFRAPQNLDNGPPDAEQGAAGEGSPQGETPTEAGQPSPSAPESGSDPKAGWTLFLVDLEEKAKAAGLDPEKFDKGLAKYVVKCGVKGREWTMSPADRAGLVAAVTERRGVFA